MDWMAIPPLSALRAFAALYAEGTMSAAGVRLNVSHAAVSQQVKALEAHLGLALVERGGRVPVLTPEGQRLGLALEDGFGMIARSLDEMTGRDASRALQVTTTPSFAAFWLMPRLADFRRLHPEIDLMLDVTAKLVPLEAGGTDVAIRYGAGEWAGVEARMLLASPMVVVASSALVGNVAFSDPADMAGFPWLQELGTSESSDWLRRHGVTSGRSAGLVELPGNLMLDAARDGQGVVVTVRAFIEADIASGRLRLLFEDAAPKGYHAVTRAGLLRPAARSFVQWLMRQARSVQG